MRRKRHLVAIAMATALGGGMLFQSSSNFGCESFFGETSYSGLDLCFIFDCSGGIFGGTLSPCGAAGADDDIFVDCPDDGN